MDSKLDKRVPSMPHLGCLGGLPLLPPPPLELWQCNRRLAQHRRTQGTADNARINRKPRGRRQQMRSDHTTVVQGTVDEGLGSFGNIRPFCWDVCTNLPPVTPCIADLVL